MLIAAAATIRLVEMVCVCCDWEFTKLAILRLFPASWNFCGKKIDFNITGQHMKNFQGQNIVG